MMLCRVSLLVAASFLFLSSNALALGDVSKSNEAEWGETLGGLRRSSSKTTSSGRSTIADESSCNSYTNKDSCFAGNDDETGLPCEWCVAGAIPSECMSQDQAKLLPEGVFDCLTPSVESQAFEFLVDLRGSRKSSLMVSADDAAFKRRYTVRNAQAPVQSDLCDPSSKSLSGYMDISGSKFDANGENKHLFYWMFEKRNSDNLEPKEKEAIPFVVWLTGGPGCSSTLALLSENGPCSVNKDGKSTSVNMNSWTEAAHVLWLDQPAGVGYSYGKETDYNEEMISEDAYYFLQAFFQTYPEYSNNPLYITGESYGGHYVSAIAHRIWMGNKEAKEKTIPLSLVGVAIGNGLTSPEQQYPSYPEMVFNNSHQIKIVNEETYKAMKQVVPRCTALIHQCNQGDSFFDDIACNSAFVVCNAGLTSPYQMTGLNPYDIRKKCDYPPLCYDFSFVTDWLNLPETKKALNVDEKHSHRWDSCNFNINMKFHKDWMKDFSGDIAELLNLGIPALIYAGDVDFICNYIGNDYWTYNLEWKNKDEFQKAGKHDWQAYGTARSAHGLTFLQVFDAGHMVPADKPEVALEMMKVFLNGGDF